MCIIFLKSVDIFYFILLKLGLILYYDVQIAISFETFSLCVTKSFIFVVLHNFKKLVFESVSELGTIMIKTASPTRNIM